MKMIRTCFCVALVLISVRLRAAEITTNAELRLVAAAMQPLLRSLDPKPGVDFPEDSASLIVSYRSQLYKIHGHSMSGEVSTNTHDQIGPGFKGFVLSIHLQDKGEINQADTPQTIQEPYWRTDLDVTSLAGSRYQIYWALSYGSRADPNLLSQIRRRINALSKPPRG